MSNIKYIYLKKIHKVPSNITNYYNLIETIRNTYKQLKNIYLFAIINPINPENPNAITEINSDVTFQQLKMVYHQQGWPSIKLLVTETQNYQEALNDSWNLLNQSVVTTENKNKDASTLFQPSDQDQWQQISPLLGNIGTQTNVQQIDNSQNTNNIDYRENKQLQQLIDDIIDSKLKELGLIPNQIDPSDYQFLLTSKRPKYTANPNKNLNIQLSFQNNGRKKWYNPFITNTILNLHQKCKDMAPGESVAVMISVPFNPQHFIGNEQICYKFKINVENEQGQLKQVYGDIPIIVKAPSAGKKLPQEEKISQLIDIFPQKGDKYLTKFVKEHGKDKTIDQLIEQLLG